MSERVTVKIEIDQCSHCPNYNFTGDGDDYTYCDHPDAPLSFRVGNDFIPIKCPRYGCFTTIRPKKKPIVVVVNGFPTSGKDTFCDFARLKYETTNYSTVDTVKDLATTMGWDGEKTPKNRNMLSALKDFYVEWFDGTFREIERLIDEKYLEGEDDFIFLHTREPVEIERVVNWCTENDKKCYSVFIDRPEIETVHGNHADANVTGYKYDRYIINDGTLEDFKTLALDIFKQMMDNTL